ncbi:MAG TPA: EAL domain-containing protein [Acidobacteriaceae bacterium]|nr:EAL domain-containing protein [Acidobacteriaceae bacterium]
MPVNLHGQITFVDAEWRILFLRDATGSIFVQLPPKTSSLRAGDLIDVVGVTAPGDVGSNIIDPKLRVAGTRPLSAPRNLSVPGIEAGLADSQYVVTEGVIRPGPFLWNHTSLLLVDGDAAAPIIIPGGVNPAAQGLIGTHVVVRGVSAVRLDEAKRPTGYQLFVQSLNDIRPLNPIGKDPFGTAVTPLSAVCDCNLNERFLPPTHVRGRILWEGDGELVLGDGSGTVRVLSTEFAGAEAGAEVDVIGFASLDSDSVVLRDSVIHVLQEVSPAAGAASPVSLTALEALKSARDGELARLSGRVLSENLNGSDHRVLVDDSGNTFEVLLAGSTSSGAFVTLTPGTVIEASGILRRIRYRDHRPDSIQLLVSSPSQIVIRPAVPVNWRLVILVLALVMVLAVLVWNAQLRRSLRLKMGLLRAQLEHEAKLETRYRRLVERNLAAVFSWRASGEIIDCNLAFARMLGYGSPEEVIGQSYWSLTTEGSHAAAIESGTANGTEISLRRPDGTLVNLLENTTLVNDAADPWYETTALDITELQKARDAARKEAEVDALTGLPNRRRFSQLVQQHLHRAAAMRQKVALLYLDLDGFKEINDTSGHLTGDLLLRKVADRLRAVLGDGDELCRLGGDEFAVVLTRRESLTDSSRVATSLIGAMQQPFQIGEEELQVSASVGISEFPEPASDYTSLLQQADSAMYVAKRAGRNRAAFYTPDVGQSVRERNQILAELRGAISRNEIFLHYQPEFNWREQRIVRFEALARWNNRVLGNVCPGKFIPLAEESGLIGDLGAHVLETACTAAVEWQSRTGQAIPVAVNVSTIQLRSDSFAEVVFGTLARTRLPAHLLELELTESIMLEDMQRCREILTRLRAAGVRLALDDFGTGYSSLSYLPDLPFDRIKIARSFLEKVNRGRGGEALIRAVVSVAHTLQMAVVAEGIETEKELSLIRSLGVDELQGYLLGRPGRDPISIINAKRVQLGPASEPSRGASEPVPLARLSLTHISSS